MGHIREPAGMTGGPGGEDWDAGRALVGITLAPHMLCAQYAQIFSPFCAL